MSNSFFDLGIPEHLPIRQVIWDYCKVEIDKKDLKVIFEDLEKSYTEIRKNLQPTYGQFSSYRLYLRFNYFKKKILESNNWPEVEIQKWRDLELFKLK